MAMQQSGKGAGDGSAPNLSDEQAEQFASSFTPAWDADDSLGDNTHGTANATLVDNPAVAAALAAAPAPNLKQTLVGTAPAANQAAGLDVRAAAPSAEAIDPENILESNTAPQPAIAPKPAPAQAAPAQAAPAQAAPAQPMMKTQLMQGAPGPVAAQAKAQARPAAASAAPAAAARGAGPKAPNGRAVAVSADPFKRLDDDEDFVPKKSSKTLIFVIGGLAVAAGIGLVAKFAMSDDAPKPPATTQAVGPAITTAEIPPPPPKVEAPAAPAATAATTATVAAATAIKPPDPLPAPTALAAPTTPSRPSIAEPPPRAAEPPPRAAPARQPRTAAQPPQAAAAPLTPPASPKTPPKGPNTGIVRDNPF